VRAGGTSYNKVAMREDAVWALQIARSISSSDGDPKILGCSGEESQGIINNDYRDQKCKCRGAIYKPVALPRLMHGELQSTTQLFYLGETMLNETINPNEQRLQQPAYHFIAARSYFASSLFTISRSRTALHSPNI
jgi:hypothetical protein